MIEELNKTQLVLLTLLVSFVVSIGTGIITFSLLQEAPPTVTQTINRVVERTIQQVVPEDTSNGNKQTVKEVTTVVVKEEDEVIDSISKITPSIVRISDDTNVDGVSPFYGIGVVISKDGLIVAPVRDTFNAVFTYSAAFSDNSTYQLKYLGQDKGGTVTFFRVIPKNQPFTGSPAALAGSNAKLGQTVVAVEGQGKNIVTVGRVAELVLNDPSDPKTQYGVAMDTTLRTDILGAPIVNLSGEIIGFRTAKQTALGAPIFVSPVSLNDSITSYENQ